ncbi:hypothetical protein H0H93_000449 [Arthromyces matolae]|nr:hypothetical protein H0H93_000449 [Arthromyces matolae]
MNNNQSEDEVDGENGSVLCLRKNAAPDYETGGRADLLATLLEQREHDAALIQELGQDVASLRQQIEDLEGDVFHPHTPARRKKVVRATYPFHTPQTRQNRSARHNKTMEVTRTVMAEMLGCKTAKKFPLVLQRWPHLLVSEEQLEDYFNGEIHPTLNPIQICLDSPSHPWNSELATIFSEHVVNLPEYSHFELDANEVAEHFICRLDTLRKAHASSLPADEGEEISAEQKRMAGLVKEQVKRRRTRQNNLFLARRDICEEKMDDRAWALLFDMVDKLGVEGQSSDESDDDEKGPYRVKTQAWRNPNVTSLLRHIDSHRPTRNHLGNRRPGAASRERKIVRDMSTRPIGKIPAKRPSNMYNDGWYEGLSNVLKAKLGPQPPLPLPQIRRIE